MYKSKDFIKRPVKEDIQIWDSTDKKYYISTALIDGAKFYLYEWLEVSWELISEEDTFEDCIKQLNDE